VLEVCYENALYKFTFDIHIDISYIVNSSVQRRSNEGFELLPLQLVA